MLKKKINEAHYTTNSTLSNTSLNTVFKSKEEKNKKLKQALLDRTQIHSSQNSNNVEKYKNLSVIVKQRSTNIINYKKDPNNINKIQSFNTVNSNKIGRNKLIRLSNSTERLEPLKCICCTCCCCCCPFFTPIKFYRSKSRTRRRKNSFNHQRNSTLINIKKYLTNSTIKNVINRKNRKIDANMNLSSLLKKFKMQQTQKNPSKNNLVIKNKKIEEKINKIKEEKNKIKEGNNKTNELKNINKEENNKKSNDGIKNKINELKNINKENNKKSNDRIKNKINELKNINKEENKKNNDRINNKINELKNINKENNKKSNDRINNKINELKNLNKEEKSIKNEQKINKYEPKNIIKFEKLKKLKKKVKYDLTKINDEESKQERINNILYGIPYMNEKKECELCHKLVASHTYKFHFYSHPSKILNWLFLGTFKNANNLDEINSFGIKHILNCAIEIIPKNIPNNIKYCHVNMLDDQNIDITLYFKKAFGFIEQARKKGEKILIHCKLGISRSPALLIGYFIKYRRFTTDSALEFIKSKRSQVHPNIGFIEQLYSYEKSLKQNQKNENNGSISNSTTMEYSISK